jgi:hypothetical protein
VSNYVPNPPLPRISTFYNTTQIVYSGGQPFTGFILIGIVSPTNGAGTTTYMPSTLGYTFPDYPLPTFTRASVINGYLDGISGCYYNADMNPPNTQYVAWYYDENGTQLAGPTAFYTVSTPTNQPPLLTLTTPTVGSVAPTPA